MAVSTEHRFQFKDIAGTTFQVDIEKEGYSGSVNTIAKATPEPVRIRRRATKTDGDLIIIGSELEFNFMVSPDDLSTWNSVLLSQYKDYRISFYEGSSLKWRGWLKPSNFKRDFVENGQYHKIKLSATDAIGDLKDFEFVDSVNTPYTDRVSIISQVKRALEKTDIELDFRVQLNTYETNEMLSTECALSEVTADSRRFQKTENGRVSQEKCDVVLKEILKPFNVALMQSDGKYWIVNYQEPNSYYFPITWSSLAVGTRTASNLLTSLSGAKFEGRGSLETIKPLKAVEITFQDRNLADNLVVNGDFDSGTTSWNEEGFASWGVTGGYLQAIFNTALDTSVQGTVYSDAIAIAANGSEDKLKVNARVKLGTLTPDNNDYEPVLQIKLFKGATWATATEVNYIGGGGTKVLARGGSLFVELEQYFPLTDTSSSNYYVAFYVEPKNLGIDDYTFAEIQIDDVEMVPIWADGSDVTYDRLFTVENTDNTFLETDKRIIKFGDSINDDDIGAFKVGSTRTEDWNRYGKTDGLSIQKLYGLNQIERFSANKNSPRVDIVDENKEVEPHKALIINSINYAIIGYSVSYKSGSYKTISTELEEIKDSAVGVSYGLQQLTSIDGKSSDSGTTIINTSNPSTGGVEIDDTTTASDKVWSSSKTDTEIQGLDLEDVTDTDNGTHHGISLKDDSAGTNKVVFTVDADGNLKLQPNGTAENMRFTQGNTLVMDKDITPSSTYAIQTRKPIQVGDSDGYPTMTLYNNKLYTNYNGLIYFKNVDSNGVWVFTAGSYYPAIMKKGNVRIKGSSATDYATYPLDVRGDINTTGSYRVNAAPLDLNHLNTVSIVSPANQDVLAYSGSSWSNTQFDLDLLTDVTISAVASGEVLKYSGSEWVNNSLDFDDLGDVAITSPTNGQILKYYTATSKWENVDNSNSADNISADTTNFNSILSSADNTVQKALETLDEISISELSNVDITSVTNGDILQYNILQWENTALLLSSATDVDSTTPANGQVLKYSTTSNTWGPGTVSSGASNLSDLGDVSIVSLASGDVLAYNGSAWANDSFEVDNLSNVDAPLPSDGQVLTYVVSSGKWEPTTPAGSSTPTLAQVTAAGNSTSTNIQTTANIYAKEAYINNAVYVDNGSSDGAILVATDSYGNDTCAITVNDGHGNFNIGLNAGVGTGAKVVSTDGISKILFGGHSNDGYVSLNAGGSGAGDELSIGLIVNGADDSIGVGDPANMTGLASSTYKIADKSGNLFAQHLYVGGNLISFNDLNDVNVASSASGSHLIYNGSTWGGQSLSTVQSNVNYWTKGTNVLTYANKVRVGDASTITTGAELEVNGRMRSINSTSPPSAGQGLEFFYGSSIGYVFPYDRDASVYKELQLRGYPLRFHYQVTEVMRLVSTQGVGIKTTSLTSGYALEVGGKVRATDFTASSDRRLKDNIKPVNDALSIISKLEPVGFTWKGRRKQKYGFIAQDVLNVMPDTVVKGAEGYYSLNYNDFSAIAIAGVQELNDSLKKEIIQLKRRLTKLEKNGTAK